MLQKCSRINVLEVFFKEPRAIHYIREISRKIKLAPTSVTKHLKELKDEGLIIEKRSNPFNGYVANRDNEKFIYYKRVYNLYSLYELNNEIIKSLYPRAIVLFGSYSLGEDIEESDVDIIVLTNKSKQIDVKKYESQLSRKVSLIVIDDLKKLDEAVRDKVHGGIVLYGGLNGR